MCLPRDPKDTKDLVMGRETVQLMQQSMCDSEILMGQYHDWLTEEYMLYYVQKGVGISLFLSLSLYIYIYLSISLSLYTYLNY